MLGYLAAAWLALAAVEGTLMVAVLTSLHEPRLHWSARLALGASELILLAPAVLVTIGPVAIWLERWRRWRQRGRAIAFVGLLPPVVATAGLLFMLAVSWGTYRTTGRFLDLDSLRLWAANPLQMVAHVVQTEAVRLAWVSAAVVAGAVLACTALVSALSHASRQRLRRLWFTAALGLVASGLGAATGELWWSSAPTPVGEPDTGAISSLGEVYVVARADRTGPVIHAVAAARGRSRTVAVVTAASDIRVVRRKQISIEEYRASIDPARVRPYNVIVMLLESLRPDQLPSFGGSRDVMPALDRLARASVAFTRAYCQANNSLAGDPCAFSGHYPVRDRGTHIYPVDPPYPRVMIYDLLKANGYRTAIFSSQNEGWGGMLNYLDTGHLDTIFHAENAPESTYLEASDVGFAGWVGDARRAGKLDDRVTIDAAGRWIDEAPAQPFFVYLNLQSSHLPYHVPADFERPFGPDTIDFNLTFGNYPRDRTAIVKNLYADSLRYMDLQIERLIEHLTTLGVMERTVIVATGDSGEAFYEHGFSAHANRIYNELMRVPLIVHAPGLPPTTSIAPAQQVDIPPTILGLLGMPPHPSFQGIDLLGSPPPPDRCLYLSIQLPDGQQIGIVRGDFKLIFDLLHQRAYLYDLARDPGETRDLSLELPLVTRALLSRLNTWYEAQVRYYGDRERLRHEYPPVVAD